MRKILFAILVATVVIVGASAPVARAAFNGKVCSLLTTKQVAAAHVTPPKCINQKTTKISTWTNYYAHWGSTSLTATTLDISLDVYRDTSSFQAFRRQIRTSISYYGSPQKVSGIGSLAYEAKKGSRGEIRFVVGHSIVSLSILVGGSAKLKSFTPLNVLARAVAAGL
jgi:hypothetical protein